MIFSSLGVVSFQKRWWLKLAGIPDHALAGELVDLKRQPETLWLKECHSQVLQQVLMDLETGFTNFFEKRAKYPRFKSRKRTRGPSG